MEMKPDDAAKMNTANPQTGTIFPIEESAPISQAAWHELTNSRTINFKYCIEDKVYFRLDKKNGVIRSRTYVENIDVSRNIYLVHLSDGGEPMEINEKWLEAGHRVE